MTVPHYEADRCKFEPYLARKCAKAMLASSSPQFTLKARFQTAAMIGWLTAAALIGALMQAAPAKASVTKVSTPGPPDPSAAIASFSNLELNFTVGTTNTYGYEFTTAGPIAIKSLGVFDFQSDGLNTSHEVGIWDSSGTELKRTTVSSGTASSLINGFRYESLTSILILQAGTYRIGALYAPGSDGFAQQTLPDGSATAGAGITLGDPFLSGPNGSLTRPINSSPSVAPGYFGPNFQYQSVPGPLPLFGAATAFGFSRRLRRRIRSSSSVGG